MGSIMGKAMDENMQKQQAFMKANQRDMLERQIQMQNFFREQQMAMGLAKARDLFYYWGAFYSLALPMMAMGFKKTRNPALIAPVLPLTFIVAYLGDMALGNKMGRVRVEADKILTQTPHLLDMPSPLPSVELLDQKRFASKAQD